MSRRCADLRKLRETVMSDKERQNPPIKCDGCGEDVPGTVQNNITWDAIFEACQKIRFLAELSFAFLLLPAFEQPFYWPANHENCLRQYQGCWTQSCSGKLAENIF
jgi:hypothetical protein